MGSAAVSLRLNMEGTTEGRPVGMSDSSGSIVQGREGAREGGACGGASEGVRVAGTEDWCVGGFVRVVGEAEDGLLP